MKCCSILTALLLLSSVRLYANSPSLIPWPVGSTLSAMSEAKTLMASYGEFTNDWGECHRGIDIDENTEAVNGDYVRCVEDGYVRRKIPTTSNGWSIVIAPTMSSDNGWVYGHLDALNVANPDGKVWEIGDQIDQGDLIQVMDPDLGGPNHVHFAWVEVWDIGIALVNPLDYFGGEHAEPIGEVEEPEGSDYWQFNPEGNSTKFLILPEKVSSDWSGWSPSEVEAEKKENDFIAGEVDLFYGVTLQGVGMGTVPEDSTNCNPERVYWELIRDEVSGPSVLQSSYVVNFDCTLSDVDLAPKMFYFRHRMWNIFEGNRAPLMCLTNCGDAQNWENLGISNIQENSWYTNMHYNQMPREETINPILAEYPDGAYQVDVTCYAHVNGIEPDPEVTFNENISCELHNFHPALREVYITDTVTEDTYYHATWEPNGLSAELTVSDNDPAQAGAHLQVILVFTEEMNTSATPTAVLGPVAVSDVMWSSSFVPNDTWKGEVTLPSSLTDDSYILSVSGVEDVDGNLLMNPAGAGTVPGPSRDTHHSLDLGFETGLEWTVSVHDEVRGSPKLADMDGDGDLDIIIQSADGWVDVLDDNGSSMWGGAVDGGWQSLPWDPPTVIASPAIANLSSSGNPEVIAVNPNGCNGFSAGGTAIQNWEGIMIAEDPDPNIAYALRWYSESSPVCFDAVDNSYHEFAMGRNRVLNGTHIGLFQARHTDGSSLWGTSIGTENSLESVSATPCIADVDNDGDLEVIVATSNKETSTNGGTDESGWVYCYNAESGDEEWSYNTGVSCVYSNVVAADLDGDDYLEIVVGLLSLPGAVRVIDGYTGTVESWGNLSTGSMIYSGASIADIDSNGINDIVVSCVDYKVYCWEGGTGNNVPGFPASLASRTNSGISIGDVDTDGMLELVFAGKDGKLYVINHDGSMASGFPITVSETNELSGQPALGDIDGDGRLEIIFGERDNSVLHCYEMGDNTSNVYLPWPQFQHNAQNTGYFPTDIAPPAPPSGFTGDGELVGSLFTVDLNWIVSVNDPESTTPQLPTDVVSYRIYRKIPPRDRELIATLPAGTSEYSDVILFTSIPIVCAYYAASWDGVNESTNNPMIKVAPGGMDNIAFGCPVREISNSADLSTHHDLTSLETIEEASLSDNHGRSNCRVLTDGGSDEAYFPTGSAECVEIDFGRVFRITDVIAYRENFTRSESGIAESSVLISDTFSERESFEQSLRTQGTQLDDCIAYELSLDGRSFTETDRGNARFIRIYDAAGATEIEVYGEASSATSAPVSLQRNAADGYRIASVEGSPLTVTAFDLTGRTVWSSTSSSGEVLWNRCSSTGNSVPSGIYLLMVESEDMETFTAKVVVR